MKESDMFDPLKEWFESRGHEVFAEVSPSYTGSRADIIARNRPAITAIEMKTSLSLEVVDQAIGWRRFCHYIYIAIPKRKKQIPQLVKNILIRERVGLLEVNLNTGGIREQLKAKFNRPQLQGKIDWDIELKPEHQTWLKGGSSGGGFVTTYKLTMRDIKKYLEQQRKSDERQNKSEGWRTVKDILNYCETHYSSPKNSLAKALLDFEHDWCESKKEKGKLYFRSIN